MATGITVNGLKELQYKMTQIVADLTGPPAVAAMRDIVLSVQGTVMRESPTDTSELRSSEVVEVTSAHGHLVQGIIGTRLAYSEDVELGGPPRVIPWGVLSGWARRHGIAEGAVRRSIARIGISVWALRKYGTMGFRMFERSLDMKLDEIHRKFDRFSDNTVRK